jgi:erythromycin esterase
MRRTRRASFSEASETTDLVNQVRDFARPLHTEGDLDPLLERIGDAHFVLLGEASHGTSEFYTWRARLSRRLIEERGFAFLAVEGDWPDCYAVNRYVKGYPDAATSARDALGAFRRWPTWMWANKEIAVLVDWLRQHNDGQPEEKKAGFYGLDVYSMWD